MADPAVQMLEMRQATRRKVNKAGRIAIDDTVYSSPFAAQRELC